MANSCRRSDSSLFSTFFHRWIDQLELYQLQHEAPKLAETISALFGHYQALYEEHSLAVEINAYQFFNPPWLSSLEKTFLWIGGWKSRWLST